MSNANNEESLASLKFFQSPAFFTACYGVTTSGDTLGTQAKFEAASKVYLNTVVPGYLKWLAEEANCSVAGLTRVRMGQKTLAGDCPRLVETVY